MRIDNLLDRGVVSLHFMEQQKPVDAVATPFPSWNRQCRDDGGGKGLARGWYVTVAGATGSGKSLLGINLAAKAIRAGERVGYVTAEMSHGQLATRLFAALTGTAVRGLERGSFDPNLMRSATAELDRISNTSGGAFFTTDHPVHTLPEVQRLLVRLRDDLKCTFYVIDYLQLLVARDTEKLFTAVSDASAMCREFARRSNAVVIGLSQFNRRTTTARKARPMVDGLMGASSIENDSDQVVMLDHTRIKKAGDGQKQSYLLIGKNRHGGKGEIPVLWDYNTLRVWEREPE